MPFPTAKQFGAVLKSMKKPGGRQPLFLQAHYKAPGRAQTATRLAQAAGYVDFRGINLWYGRLAEKVGSALGHKNAGLALLVDFAPPRSVSNREWVLIMRPEFAEALKQSGWVN
ncbi:hypothetical protein [Arenimonas alkanexedens]